MLCKDLGIDDPIAWYNSAPSAVVDQWFAYYSLESDEMSSNRKGVSPNQALNQLMSGQR